MAVAPAVLLTAVYDVCDRLMDAGVLYRMHPEWSMRHVTQPMLSQDRALVGAIITPAGRTPLRIDLSSAHLTGRVDHSGSCPSAPYDGASEPLTLPLFDAECGSLCPWGFDQREDYVAHRLVPAIARAAGRSQWDVYRYLTARPLARDIGVIDVRPLVDTLFGD